jgi:L-serine dehydratase
MNKSCSKQEESAVKMPSILNEVIGPVMRGPSSSHSAAAVRIGCIARALMGNDIDEVLVEFDETGSLPTTYSSQGSGMGLCGGLLGFAASEERLIAYREEMKKARFRFAMLLVTTATPIPIPTG